MTARSPPPPPPPHEESLEPVHDFVGKLRGPALLPRVLEYAAWERARRAAEERGLPDPPLPHRAPVSINLDLTTACNYACTHCIDWEALNRGTHHDPGELLASLDVLAERGLRSVILIGGGEPTVHPGFVEVTRRIKALALQVAIVSNGSRNDRIAEVFGELGPADWVRLSLDAGSDATFQAMHRPRRPITLESICAWVPRWKAISRAPRVGFSFIVTWQGAAREAGAPVVENLHEIPLAARLARDAGFDYIAFKPFLARSPEGAEVLDPASSGARLEEVLRRVRTGIAEARRLESPGFRVLESTNLRLLESGAWEAWTRQPRTCHMQALRQVLSPLGLYNCPAHRGVPRARIAGRDAFADAPRAEAATAATQEILRRFDASVECREVTCLYHAANWWIEGIVAGAEEPGTPAPDGPEDAFL